MADIQVPRCVRLGCRHDDVPGLERRIVELENALRIIASHIDDPEGMSDDAVLDLARSVAYEALGIGGTG